MSLTPACQSMLTRHMGDLRQYCFYLTKSKWDAEDLCQDALLKATVYFSDKSSDQNMKYFLFRIARNLWIDICRVRQRRRHLPLLEHRIYHIDSNYAEVRSLVEWMNERLSVRNIEMWLLSEYFGYTMQEMAEATQCSVPAVKSVLSRTRRQLRKFKEGEVNEAGRSAVLRLDVECWTKAVMRELPPCL